MPFVSLFLVLFILPVVGVIVLFALFYSSLWKTKVSTAEQKNDDLKSTISPIEKQEWGLVEIENIYRNKQMDTFIKGLFKDRLIKWEGNEDVALNWKGKHLIRCFLINGGYEEVIVEVNPSKTDVISVNKDITTPFTSSEPIIDPKKECKIWMDENYPSIIRELKNSRLFTVLKKDFSITEEVWKLIQKELVDTGDFTAVELCSDNLKVTRG